MGLVGFAEIVRLLGVNPKTARRYVDRPDFPAPVAELSVGRIWEQEAVEQWAKQTLPLRSGRPPTKRLSH